MKQRCSACLRSPHLGGSFPHLGRNRWQQLHMPCFFSTHLCRFLFVAGWHVCLPLQYSAVPEKKEAAKYFASSKAGAAEVERR